MAIAATRKVADDAAAWLARLVDERGRVGYAMDAASGRIVRRGVFAHGRAAAVIRALDAHGGHSGRAALARRRLATEIDAALAGQSVPDWPSDASQAAGTLALAVLAGIDVREPLEAAARRVDVPWHAAQCVVALGAGSRTARRLFGLCVRDLPRHPFAPWTAIASRTIGDREVLRRCMRTLAGSIRRDGGVGVTAIPEIALTAITIQALAPLGSAAAVCRRARAFLRRNQSRERCPVRGAFPASPAAAYYRADITAHALLALISRT